MKIRRLLQRYVRVKQTVAELVPQIGINATAARLGLTRKFVRYTHEKHQNPEEFHPGPIGGAHHMLLDEPSRNMAELLLWYEVKANPARRDTQFAVSLQNLGTGMRLLPLLNAVWSRCSC